jgi:chromate transporter
MTRSPSIPPTPSGCEHISLPRLLVAFFKIGSIGFGGGMAVIALMEREFVQKRRLLSAGEFLQGVGLGQILGAFSVNASFFVGYRLYGFAGGILSATVFLMPSLALVTALSHLYFRYHALPALQGVVGGLGPVVIALILDAAWSLGGKLLRSPAAICIAAAALVAGALRVNAVWVILAAGLSGLILPHPGQDDDDSGSLPRAPTLSSVALPFLAGPLTLLGPLAISFLRMGVVFFGGGFALVPVLHHRLVTELGWLNTREFLDGVAISNLTPGPIAVLATFAGYRVAGVAGGLVATAALMAPAIGLMWLISGQYARYRRRPAAERFLAGVNPAVTGLVCSAAVLLGGSAIVSWRGWILAVTSLLLLRKFHWHPAFVLAVGAATGYAGLLP